VTPATDRFTWGVATSAYQIEGAADAPGKGESIWDAFVRRPGAVAGGDTGDVATDHLARMEEDLDLIAGLGVDAYRFSVAWTRIQPDGRGAPRRAGLDVYDRVVDGLLARGVAPWVCLYHWDLPRALQEAGGWADRDTAHRFADYARLVAERLGDRARHWAMLNEPNVHAVLGHLLGVHAPGVTDPQAYGAAAHHQNLATGLGIRALRTLDPALRLGTIVSVQPALPARKGEADRAAADLFDAVWHGTHLEPLARGRYPEATAPFLAPWLRDGDLEVARAAPDFLGVNHYTRQRVAADPAALLGLRLAPPPAGAETTAMGWEVAPAAFRDALLRLSADPDLPPLVVTENGAAYDDRPGPGGRVRDDDRIAYLRRYLAALAEARAAGARVDGYFVWTLLDNFEWAEGYAKRFGLVRVAGRELRRIPKASYDAYARIVRAGGVDGGG
jgi:beta-glucosidase